MWFWLVSLLSSVMIFVLLWLLRVLVGLLVRMIWLLFISVWVIDICCCWLLDNWCGWLVVCLVRFRCLSRVCVWVCCLFVGMLV